MFCLKTLQDEEVDLGNELHVYGCLPCTLAPAVLPRVDIKHVVKLVLYFPVVSDGMEDTLAVLYRADVIRHL